jgi:hypothetical protein
MIKKIRIVSLGCFILLAAAGCASLEWRTAPRAPAIKELGSVKSLGVFSFTPVLRPFGRFLIKSDKTFYVPIEIEGLRRKVALLYTSPEAITLFAANADSLATLCREVSSGEIGNTGAFDYDVSKGYARSRVMGRPLPEDSASPVEEGMRGYDFVAVITESFDRDAVTARNIIDLGESYGVDAVLGLELTAIGEIGRVSDQPSRETFGKDVPIGNFVLLVHVGYEYALFDAGTGAKITDSTDTRPEYSTLSKPEDAIVDLGTKDIDALSAFLSGSRYIDLFAEPMKRALVPYLTLFRSTYIATLQEVKK